MSSDEIDLFEVIETLIEGRTTLAAFVAVFAVIGLIFISISEPKYSTTAPYKISQLPPDYVIKEAQQDLSNAVFNAKNFSRWKAASPDTALFYGMIDEEEFIETISFAIPREARFLAITSTDIVIRTKNVRLIEETLDYVKFAGKIVEAKYRGQAEREIRRINAFIETVTPILNKDIDPVFSAFNMIAAQERFLETIVEGKNVFQILRPLKPIKTSISKTMLLLLSSIFGAGLGGVFLLTRKAYSARNLSTPND